MVPPPMHGLPASTAAIHTIRAPGDEHVAAALAAAVTSLAAGSVTPPEKY